MASFTQPTTPAPPTAWDIIDEESKLKLIEEYFNLPSDNPKHSNGVQSKLDLNEMATHKFQFVTMIGGPNAGERRQVFTDANNAKYYEQGSSGRKIYLTNWVNSKKKQMPPTASAGLIQQFNNPGGINPITLFLDDEDPDPIVVCVISINLHHILILYL